MHTLVTWGKISLLVSLPIVVLLTGIVSLLFILNMPPEDFPTNTDFRVEEGMTVRQVGTALKEDSYIQSAFLFRFLVRSSYSDIVIQAGSYRFTAPYTTRGIIEALKTGGSRSPAVILTFPEGFTVYDFEEYAKNVFDNIDVEALTQYEGFLFPDTYFVSETETVEDLVRRMREEYAEKIAPFRERIAASGMSEREVITLASILEREANDEISMRTVSGILHNRLESDLPLQVDAAFEYILGKTSAELTMEDLSIDSPYNTYLYRGLPPTPIANPGLASIDAALAPIRTDFYYYLTGLDGTFHYARTFEEHKLNKERYLE